VLGQGSPGQAQGDEGKGYFFHVLGLRGDPRSGGTDQVGQKPTTATHIVTHAPGVQTCF
jgi:hypothetical protein